MTPFLVLTTITVYFLVLFFISWLAGRNADNRPRHGAEEGEEGFEQERGGWEANKEVGEKIQVCFFIF